MVPKFIETGKTTPLGGFLEYDGPDGGGDLTPNIAHLRDVPELKYVIGVGAHIKEIDAAFFNRLHSMAWLFAAAMLVIGLLGSIIGRSIREPLSNAVGKIKSLATGNLHIAPANADEKSEIGEVDKALDVLRENALEQQTLQEKVREQNELLLRQHEKSEELLRQFVEQAPVAMLMLDCNMVHLACSRHWVEFIGDKDGGIGRYHYDVFAELAENWKEAHGRALAGETVRINEEPLARPNGEEIMVSWEARPWLRSDETIGGITILCDDVTSRVVTARALRENELRMRLAQEAARTGAWEWRLADNQIRWSELVVELVRARNYPSLGADWRYVRNANPSRGLRSRYLGRIAVGCAWRGDRNPVAPEVARRRTRALVYDQRQANSRRRRRPG